MLWPNLILVKCSVTVNPSNLREHAGRCLNLLLINTDGNKILYAITLTLDKETEENQGIKYTREVNQQNREQV